MTREEELALAEDRKVARRLRTSRIRRLVATVAAAAFIGPFALIYGNVAAGKDPALVAQTTVVQAAASDTSTADSSASTSGDSDSTTTSSAPAAVTTQQS